jgi:hypothetical protein
MCGRFTLRSSGEVVAEAFGLPEFPDLLPPSTSPPVTRSPWSGSNQKKRVENLLTSVGA